MRVLPGFDAGHDGMNPSQGMRRRVYRLRVIAAQGCRSDGKSLTRSSGWLRVGYGKLLGIAVAAATAKNGTIRDQTSYDDSSCFAPRRLHRAVLARPPRIGRGNL